MSVRPCSRARCQHCNKRVAIFLIDGFGVLRRCHEAKCGEQPLKAPPTLQADATSETTAATVAPAGSSPSSETPDQGPSGHLEAASSSSSSRSLPVNPIRIVQRLLSPLSSIGCGRRNRPALRQTQSDPLNALIEDDESFVKASALLSTFRTVPTQESRALESAWLRALAAKATFVRQSVRVPPEGEGWNGPCESSESRWKIQLWYKWSAPTTISTLSRLTVRGDLCEVLSLFREADKVSSWLPFVTGGECSWSTDVPALVTSIQAKVPIVPRRFSTLIHRAFIDDTNDASDGVYVIEWTPSAEDVQSGTFCGMSVPPTPPRSSAMQVNLSTTFVYPDPDQPDSCVVIMAGENDFGVNHRLIPNLVLRKFLAFNCRVVANNISSCLQDMEQFGYTERIEKDTQGFYRAVRLRSRHPSAAAGRR